jgi:large subunit ribosomal protein L25
MSDFILKAINREDSGKGASRRLRRLENKVPAIVYGGKDGPVSISLEHDPLLHQLENEAIFSSIITLKIDGKSEDVLLKDLQRHPAKKIIMHADFLRVDKNQEIVVQVPLHFINEDTCVGVKMQSGRISHQANEIEIRCLPDSLPEFIEVDMAEIEVGQVVHLSDIKLPEEVVSVALSLGEEHDLSIASIAAPKAEVDDEETDANEADTSSENDTDSKDEGDKEIKE